MCANLSRSFFDLLVSQDPRHLRGRHLWDQNTMLLGYRITLSTLSYVGVLKL